MNKKPIFYISGIIGVFKIEKSSDKNKVALNFLGLPNGKVSMMKNEFVSFFKQGLLGRADC